MTKPCPRCGLSLTFTQHETHEECLNILAPRYRLAQQALEAMHRRYRTLEERLARAKIVATVARKEAKRNAAIPARLAAVEAALGIGKENQRVNV